MCWHIGACKRRNGERVQRHGLCVAGVQCGQGAAVSAASKMLWTGLALTRQDTRREARHVTRCPTLCTKRPELANTDTQSRPVGPKGVGSWLNMGCLPVGLGFHFGGEKTL